MSYELSGSKELPVLPHDKVPRIFNDKVFACTQLELTETEKECFSAALAIVQDALMKEGAYDSACPITVFFTDSDRFELSLMEENVYGCLTWFILFPVARWRILKFDYRSILAIMLEELCHYFWSIHSDVDVKIKAVSIAKVHFPMTLEELYEGFVIPPS